MKLSASCPCCSNIMLHHLSNHREYWFCRSCWQEMPNFANISQKSKYYQQNGSPKKQRRTNSKGYVMPLWYTFRYALA